MSTGVTTRAANRQITAALTKHSKKSGQSKSSKVRISEPEQQDPQEQPNDPKPQEEDQEQGEGGETGGGDGAGGGGDDGGNDGDNEPQDDPWDESDDEVEQGGETFTFGLTPSLAINKVLNYNTKLGSIRYKEATRKLEEDLYDCQPEGFFQFMQSVETRTQEEGWDVQDTGIMWLPRRQGGRKYNFLAEYGDFTLAEVTRHERTYVNTETRAAQNDRMLYQCLINSLSVDGKSKVNIWNEDYIIDGDNKVGEFVPSGLCYLKVIIRESYLDSNATELTIRTQLSNPDTNRRLHTTTRRHNQKLSCRKRCRSWKVDT